MQLNLFETPETVLKRIEPALNMKRYYAVKVHLNADKFELVTQWGRIGKWNRKPEHLKEQLQVFCRIEDAKTEAEKIIKQKRAKGYQLIQR